MTPWDHAHEEAHGIANAIGCTGVDNIARALLVVDEVEVEHLAEWAWREIGDRWGLDTRRWWRAGRWEKDDWREAARVVMAAQMPPKKRRLPRRRQPLPRRLLPPERVPVQPPMVQFIERSPPWAKRDNVMSLSQFEGTEAFKLDPKWLETTEA